VDTQTVGEGLALLTYQPVRILGPRTSTTAPAR
jgi:hypothetical protein